MGSHGSTPTTETTRAGATVSIALGRPAATLYVPSRPIVAPIDTVDDRPRILLRPGWVLGGSVVGWSIALDPAVFDLVIFLTTSSDTRLQRLRDREALHFGSDAVAPGGWRHEETERFIDWASHYEDGTREGRSLASQEAWLATLRCPVLRLDGARPIAELVAEVRRAIGA